MYKQQEHSVNNIAIRVNNLSKCYQLYNQPSDCLKQFLWRGRRQSFLHRSRALRGNASGTAPAVRDAERHLLSSRQELRNATLCINSRNTQ